MFMNWRSLIALVIISLVSLPNNTFAQLKDPISVEAQRSKEVAPKIPLEGFDQSWLNGNDRRDSSIFHNPFFTPSILVDVNCTHSFNNPIDHTVVGSTVIARNDEMEISAVVLGGDLNYKNAHARVMTQFGTRPMVISSNDVSQFRGQYEIGKAYRNISEAYAGYHFDKWYGINVDFGMFLSYIGLNSYYQAENWEYQESFTSDNTPWFFNGMRTQIFPNKYLRFEIWLINGWQSYGTFNNLPGFGVNVVWMPNEHVKFIMNDYYGTETPGLSGRYRFHSDNSFSLRYYNHNKSKKISKAAICATFDIGYEKGDGVNAFTTDATRGPAQYFVSAMVYNRLWFAKNKFAWTIGGGWVTNPGRYLVLYPSGDASPLPNPYNPTLYGGVAGTHPFSVNPGDPFTAWDCSTNFCWLPNQSVEFKIEYVHRESSVNYFAGHGGVTSPSGYTYSTLPGSWAPDLVKAEDRVIFAALFRL